MKENKYTFDIDIKALFIIVLAMKLKKSFNIEKLKTKDKCGLSGFEMTITLLQWANGVYFLGYQKTRLFNTNIWLRK